jgi:drug/metabolite transporter (DMT)-like permease
LIWSTGYVAGPIALRDADAFTLLAVRFALAAFVLGALAFATRAPWPRTPREAVHVAVAGLLSQAMAFGGGYAALESGLPAAVVALVMGTMPLVTALAAGPVLGERPGLRQWLGLALGFSGVCLVVGSRLDGGVAHAQAVGTVCAIVGLIGLSAGTLYQKRFCAEIDVRTSGFIQYVAAAAAMLALAAANGPTRLNLTAPFLEATAWLVAVNAIAGVVLLFTMIRDGQVSRVGSLFFLIPPVTAVLTALLLHEVLGPLALAGFAASVAGVALAARAR